MLRWFWKQTFFCQVRYELTFVCDLTSRDDSTNFLQIIMPNLVVGKCYRAILVKKSTVALIVSIVDCDGAVPPLKFRRGYAEELFLRITPTLKFVPIFHVAKLYCFPFILPRLSPFFRSFREKKTVSPGYRTSFQNNGGCTTLKTVMACVYARPDTVHFLLDCSSRSILDRELPYEPETKLYRYQTIAISSRTKLNS